MSKHKQQPIANPASTTGEPVVVSVTTAGPVTDRANRYRANEVLKQLPPLMQTRCHFCGTPPGIASLMPGHIDGDEDHNEPANISPTCRSCNSELAATFAAAQIGRRTRQFNPSHHPIESQAKYAAVVATLRKATSAAAIRRAIAMLQATPHADRNNFAKSIPLKNPHE